MLEVKLKEIRRKARAVGRKYRETRVIAKALKSPRHPIIAHIIPIRRCNLSCTYCNEFDDFSAPSRRDDARRMDQLAALGTAIVTMSGGEPLLHPELDEIIRRMREHGMIAGLITNGYLLTRRPHQAAESRRPRPPADQHRQRRCRTTCRRRA